MLKTLEGKLRTLSHSEEAIKEIETFCIGLSGTRARMDVWNCENAIVRRPIELADAKALGFDAADDAFVLLQGDLVRTEAAYSFGQRITGRPMYAVLNSSCDLVPGRTSSSVLLRITGIRRDDPGAKNTLGQLLKFSRRDSMYIPPLADDDESIVGNVIQFDGVCQIQTTDLHLANRVASLSVIGWRIFASFVRVVFTRSNPREVEIRTAIEENGAVAA